MNKIVTLILYYKQFIIVTFLNLPNFFKNPDKTYEKSIGTFKF